MKIHREMAESDRRRVVPIAGPGEVNKIVDSYGDAPAGSEIALRG
jgi:hypothetical protein